MRPNDPINVFYAVMSDPNLPANELSELESTVVDLANQVFRAMTESGATYLELGRSGYGVELFEDRLELIGPHGEGLGNLRSGVATAAMETGKVPGEAARVFLGAREDLEARLA